MTTNCKPEDVSVFIELPSGERLEIEGYSEKEPCTLKIRSDNIHHTLSTEDGMVVKVVTKVPYETFLHDECEVMVIKDNEKVKLTRENILELLEEVEDD